LPIVDRRVAVLNRKWLRDRNAVLSFWLAQSNVAPIDEVIIYILLEVLPVIIAQVTWACNAALLRKFVQTLAVSLAEIILGTCNDEIVILDNASHSLLRLLSFFPVFVDLKNDWSWALNQNLVLLVATSRLFNRPVFFNEVRHLLIDWDKFRAALIMVTRLLAGNLVR
jgi:hypothetical protein